MADDVDIEEKSACKHLLRTEKMVTYKPSLFGYVFEVRVYEIRCQLCNATKRSLINPLD